ncbi:MAG: MATE family efflux transporter [Lachnospiraceae bacterium]|nr:MATE family efflux transporter [Lachnospiraceae bacterium]
MEDEESRQYNKMTCTPVWKLVLMLGMPTTVSMLITNIYNMADTFYVSKISVAASGATGIVFALMAILQAFGFMFGHGAGSNISRLLGARKVEHAKIFASTSVFLSLATGVLIGVLGLLFPTSLMRLLGSTDTILADAKTYGAFILISGPAMTVGCVLNNILRYEGRAFFAMVGLTAGGILNMFLDPILIFTCHMGTAGAGLSTAVSQYISTAILLYPFLKGKTVTKLHPRYITKDFADIKNIVLTGLPSLTRQGLNSISTTIVNVQASVYGDAAIAAMSIVGRCSNLLFSFALGIAQGFQPVSAFNYGARKYGRVKKAAWFTMLMGMSIMGALCAACYINAPGIIRLFRDEESILEMGTGALRWMCRLLFTLPISAVGSMLFQSIGKKGRALLIAAVQSGLIFIPLILILPHFWGITGIQAAQSLAYLGSAIVTLPIVAVFFRDLEAADLNRGKS